MIKPVAKAAPSGAAAKTSSAVRTTTKKTKPRRLAVAFFYDEHGIVDEYMIHWINALKPFVEKTIFVANGTLRRDGEIAVRSAADELLVRPNVGFDVWAYKEALEHVGFDALGEFDEVILYNHTFYGPIFPLQEMFDEMEDRTCDFWGITEHNELGFNPFSGQGTLPRHLNSHFIAIRNPMLTSRMFQQYWAEMEPIGSYVESILKHESRFTKNFVDLGYTVSVYMDNRNFGSDYPLMLELDRMLEHRCPIIKRRTFFGDVAYLEANGADAPRAIQVMRKTSRYPEKLIWKNAVRLAPLRVLNENMALMSILPDVETAPAKLTEYGNIAVCAHMYYEDMLPEILSYTNNIPISYDFLATTDTLAKKQALEAELKKQKKIKKVDVRVVEQNRGRDMSSLFITFRNEFLDDRYDLVCRVHTKKTPQVQAPRGNLFKRHMLENLLNSPGYVVNLLNMLVERPWVGLAIPPLVNISYFTFGQSWYNNKSKTQEIADKMGLRVTLDEHTPVAPNGTMYWFRPRALRKMFAYEWKWGDYNAEPNHLDGGLAHAQERVIAYVAQDAGFTTEHVANTAMAARNYTAIEYKLSTVMSKLPLADYTWLASFLQKWKDAQYPQVEQGSGKITTLYATDSEPTIRRALTETWKAVVRSIRFRLRRR